MYPIGPGQTGYYGAGAFAAYGTLTLTDSSPAQSFTEPLSLLDIKTYLNLPVLAPDQTDQAQDAMLAGLISASREIAEILQHRDLVRKQWDLALDYWNNYRIELRPDLASVDLVRYRESSGSYTTLAADTGYIVDTSKRPGVILPPFNGTWPSVTLWPSSAILVRFTSGVSPTAPFWIGAGSKVKIGMKRLVSEWFNNRIPFARGATEEIPYGITACLSFGAVPRAK